MSSSIPTQRDRLNLRNHLMNLQTSENFITAEIQASRTGQYFRPLLQAAKLLKKYEKLRKSWIFSNYIRLPSITHLQLENLWKGNAFLSVSQFWPALKPGGVRDSLCRLVKTKMSIIQLPEKLKKYFVFPTGSMSCKSRCHHYCHTLLIPSEYFT